MKNTNLIKKAKELAEEGKGRRLLNTLNKRDNVFTSIELDEILSAYREIGLHKEVEMLKKRRGILTDDQYNTLAKKVKNNCCAEKYDDFAVSLRTLLSCGMKMNPTKTNTEELF
ncbi:MAG: hypothetical protein GY707_12380 [Desulfobacteraceae bacterium]|nr:hypothetical protein [Desulfobacteraceae bacterium]